VAGTALQRARKALQTHAPELDGVAIAELGRGLDNTSFAAGDLVLRVAGGGGVGREARFLKAIAPRLSLAVPEPRFADDAAGVLAYPRLPGEPMLGRTAPSGAAERLGRFLCDLHAIDPGAVAGLVPEADAEPGAWLGDLDGPRDLLDVLGATQPPPSPVRVVAHADLGAEHLLELDGELTGVIDWSDAAINDPALDFARLYRDFGPAFLDDVLRGYGPLPGAMPRIEFFARCAALEDLAYGRMSGRPEYSANAERSLQWLFP